MCTASEAEGARLPDGWSLDVLVNEQGYHVGSLAKDGRNLCNISFGQPFMSFAQARQALSVKAIEWIAEYSQREHTGETHFGDLHDQA